VGRGAELVIALYANAHGSNSRQPDIRAAYKAEQAACFAILREWVRQHIREKPEMHKFVECLYEIEGRGYLFDFDHVAWGNENDPFYLLVDRTLRDMAETFNCGANSNHSTDYALEYAYVKGNGMEYDTVRLGAYAYAVGVKVETEVAHDFITGEGL
jgi:hypothetical protein